MRLQRLLHLAALAALALPLVAHDFWIEPLSYRPAKGAIVQVTLKVGDFALGENVPRNDARIVDFSVHGPGLDKKLVGRDGGDPAGFARLEAEGVYVLGYRSMHTKVELEAAKFEGYLREKGLDRALELRASLGESAAKGREVYSRCAKALVCVGEGESSGFDHMLGYPLEILPEKNPYQLAKIESGSAAPEALPARVFFDGKPLENALIGALDLDAPRPSDGTHQEPLTARTDAQGRAQLVLPHGGRWLFAVVHMVRAEGRTDADWESYWASLTFDAPKFAAAK